jgi:hypothetical protein
VAWALINDRMKLLAYWFLDRAPRRRQRITPSAAGALPVSQAEPA